MLGRGGHRCEPGGRVGDGVLGHRPAAPAAGGRLIRRWAGVNRACRGDHRRSPKITNFHLIEAQVVTIAQTVEPAELRRILGILADQCRPEARDHTAEDLHAKRLLCHLSETPNGMFRLDGYPDLVAGAALRGVEHPDGPHLPRGHQDPPRSAGRTP